MKFFSKTHEWIEQAGENTFRMGVSKYASDQLGDIVFVEGKEEGDEIEKGGSLAILESVKAVGDVYAPFDCTVNSFNGELEDSPELINKSQDWVVEITAKEAIKLEELADFMAEDKYNSEYLASI